MKIRFIKDNTIKINSIETRYHSSNIQTVKYIKKALRQMLSTIPVYEGKRTMLFIRKVDIFYVEVVDRKVFVYTQNNVYRTVHTFKEVKEDLLGGTFIQVSKSTLVNKYKIKNLQIFSAARRVVTLENGEQIMVSRKFKEQLKDTTNE